MAIKHDIYGILVKMALLLCYCFLNVLTNPQILSYHKAKSVDECQRMFLITALSGSHEVHCVWCGLVYSAVVCSMLHDASVV